MWRPIRCFIKTLIKSFSCNNFCNICNICHVTSYQSQCQRLPRAMIGPFYDDQMVVFGQRYKQNAINVSGNESKLENVYMGIKIVKTCFGHLSSFIFWVSTRQNGHFRHLPLENTILWSWKGQKRVIYFIVSFGIYNLLKSGLKKWKLSECGCRFYG